MTKQEVVVVVWDGEANSAHGIVRHAHEGGKTMLYVEAHPLSGYTDDAAKPSIFEKLPSGLYKRYYKGATIIVSDPRDLG